MTAKRYHHCAEAQEDFSAFLDGELEADLREALEDHLADCSDCLRQLDGFRRVDLMYGALPPVAAPEGLEVNVAEQLSGKRFRFTKPTARPGYWLGPAFAAVAVLLVIVSVTATLLRTDSQRFEVTRVAGTAKTDDTADADTPPLLNKESEPNVTGARTLARADSPTAADEVEEKLVDSSAPARTPAIEAPASDAPRVAEGGGAGAIAAAEPLVVAETRPQQIAASEEDSAAKATAPAAPPAIANAPVDAGARQRPEIGEQERFQAVSTAQAGRSATVGHDATQHAPPLFTVSDQGLVQVGYAGEATQPLERDSELFRALADKYAFVAKMVDISEPVLFKIDETWYRLAPPEPPAN